MFSKIYELRAAIVQNRAWMAASRLSVFSARQWRAARSWAQARSALADRRVTDAMHMWIEYKLYAMCVVVINVELVHPW